VPFVGGTSRQPFKPLLKTPISLRELSLGWGHLETMEKKPITPEACISCEDFDDVWAKITP